MAGDEARELFEEANRLWAQGDDLGQALSAYDKALAIDPQNAYAWTYRGFTLTHLGRAQEALESFDKALDIDPQAAEAWSGRGFVLWELKRYQEAVESCEEALILAPTEWTPKDDALDEVEKWLNKRRPINLLLEPYRLVAVSEKILHRFIKRRLKEALGESEDAWWAKGVPLTIRQKCAQRREEAHRRKPLYGYAYFIDLRVILDKNWRCFEGDFQRVKGSVKSKKEFLDGLARSNELRNSVAHYGSDPSNLPTDADHEFARWMLEVIRDFVGLEGASSRSPAL